MRKIDEKIQPVVVVPVFVFLAVAIAISFVVFQSDWTVAFCSQFAFYPQVPKQ